MTDVLATTRCPQCVALVRPGQPWCTLCHADLRPAVKPAPVSGAPDASADAGQVTEAAATPTPNYLDPLTAPLPLPMDPADAAPSPGGLGRHARQSTHLPSDDARAGEPNDRSAPSDREIDAMLAELALQTGPPLPGVGGRLDSRAAKIGLAVGLCLGGIAVLFVGAIVMTAVFG